MAYKRTDNSEQIISETSNKTSLAIRFMLEAIHRKSTPKTPMKTGHLRADITKRVRGTTGTIRWGKNYAWYQERGYTSGPVKKYTTPGTGKHFAVDAVNEVVGDAPRYFTRAGL